MSKFERSKDIDVAVVNLITLEKADFYSSSRKVNILTILVRSAESMGQAQKFGKKLDFTRSKFE